MSEYLLVKLVKASLFSYIHCKRGTPDHHLNLHALPAKSDFLQIISMIALGNKEEFGMVAEAS